MKIKTFTFIYCSAYGANVEHYFITEAHRTAMHYIESEGSSRKNDVNLFFSTSTPGDEIQLTKDIVIFHKTLETLEPRVFKCE